MPGCCSGTSQRGRSGSSRITALPAAISTDATGDAFPSAQPASVTTGSFVDVPGHRALDIEPTQDLPRLVPMRDAEDFDAHQSSGFSSRA